MKLFFPVAILLFPVWGYSQTLEELSELPKPSPIYQKTKSWCQKEGKAGSDTELNLAKNRIGHASKYHAVRFAEIQNLKSGEDVAEKDRDRIDPEKKKAISKYEGIPIMLEGYFMFVKAHGRLRGGSKMGAESCNCKKTAFDHVDYHIWMVEKKNDKMRDSVVVEMTPRVRAKHGNRWTDKKHLEEDLDFIASQKIKVRVYGWLFFDGEHAEQLPKPGRAENKIRRATLWEIHPVMKVESFQNGEWKEW